MTRANRPWTIGAWGVAVTAVVLYGVFRVRFVGGCDSSSYLLEALRIRGLAPGLVLDPSVPMRGPLAPLCLTERDGVVTSVFPPGFPLLLALGSVVGLEFFVTPLLGAASGLALYYIVAMRFHAAIALGTMVAWLGSPLVLLGGTQVMSDFPAAAFSIFALLVLRKERLVLAGALAGIP